MNRYLRAATSAGMQGLSTGLWTAAGELPPSRRRLARAGAVAGLSALGAIRDRVLDRSGEPEHKIVELVPVDAPAADGDGDQQFRLVWDRRQVAAMAVTGALSVGMIIGRQRLERRWLAGLRGAGHPHPHRALAVRMGVLAFATALPGHLLTAYAIDTEAPARPRPDSLYLPQHNDLGADPAH